MKDPIDTTEVATLHLSGIRCQISYQAKDKALGLALDSREAVLMTRAEGQMLMAALATALEGLESKP